MAWCREMTANHALFLFDSCFSGTVFAARALPKLPPHISSLTAKPVRQFISAGEAGEEVPAKSVFAPSFIKGLSGEADLSGDGYVTGTELGMYLHDKVIYYGAGQTPQYGKIRDPYLNEGDFVFELNRPDEVVEKKVKREQKAPETECDRLAGQPDDLLRLSSVKGVTFDQISLPDAEIACKKAVEAYPNKPRLMFQYGRALQKAERYDEARRWYQKAADQGNAAAMFKIGYSYEKGRGMTQNYDQAVKWYQKAAKQGNVEAMNHVAWLYDNGRKIKRDAEKAARWMVSALDSGNEDAYKNMRDNSDAWSPQFRLALQKQLKKSGLYQGRLDGEFGPKTQRAIDAIFKE